MCHQAAFIPVKELKLQAFARIYEGSSVKAGLCIWTSGFHESPSLSFCSSSQTGYHPSSGMLPAAPNVQTELNPSSLGSRDGDSDCKFVTLRSDMAVLSYLFAKSLSIGKQWQMEKKPVVTESNPFRGCYRQPRLSCKCKAEISDYRLPSKPPLCILNPVPQCSHV